MKARVGDLEVSYSSRGNATYRLELWHDGLKKHRVIKGSEGSVVQRKAQLQLEDWREKWAVALDRQARQQETADKKRHQDEQRQLAVARTAEAQEEIERLEKTLQHTLQIDDAIDWNSLKDFTKFTEPQPERPTPPREPKLASAPPEPIRSSKQFQAQIGLLDHLIASWKRRKEAEAKQRYKTAHESWERKVSETRQRNDEAKTAHNEAIAKLTHDYDLALGSWEERRAQHLREQQMANEAIDRQRQLYEAADPNAVFEYCDMVLSNSEYSDCLPKEFELDYYIETKTLVVEYSLPSVESLPTLKEVKYIMSRNDLTEKHLPASQVAKLYDSLIYQITLRTVHELFEADVIGAIDAIVFNGRVTYLDRSTGHETTACIVSLQASRDEFESINLVNVDPKACFKSLKGIGSSRLHSLAPVAPILQMRREDGRFVSAREVANTLDDSMNLAIMDWSDFEHLIRELFELEFKVAGGEVSVTRASRDGGVDAIAFDPDPIRGGKIVIQAKRYTNTVGVAAVRDLFGTVMNEGANKGILVTTSDFGPDAYAFAKEKPITLLNGSNLLHLLQKHGHKARIDIKEARKQAH